MAKFQSLEPLVLGAEINLTAQGDWQLCQEVNLGFQHMIGSQCMRTPLKVNGLPRSMAMWIPESAVQ